MKTWIDRLVTLAVAAILALGLATLRAQQPLDTTLASGALVFFDRTTATGCPAGWTEVTAARGAYLVALPSGGTKATLVGTALTNLENRPAGSHNHAITDPGHFHTGQNTSGSAGSVNVIDQIIINKAANPVSGAIVDNATTGVTVNAGGGGTSGQTGVAGTNAPFIQYLLCSKN